MSAASVPIDALSSQIPSIIVDCDAGIDDAQAIFTILRAQELNQVRLLAIICTAGNCGLESVIGNVCAVLEGFGGHRALATKVYVGASKPLVAHPTGVGAEDWMGSDGLGGLGLGSLASQKYVDNSVHGAVALLEMLRVEEEAKRTPPTLLVLGPCSTLALALHLSRGDEIERRIGKLVVMGGAVDARGNAKACTSEFNIEADPEAAAVVFRTQWKSATLVAWELTTRSGLSPETVDKWLNVSTPRSKWLGGVSAFLLSASKAIDPVAFAAKGFYIPDPLAAIVALRPLSISKADDNVGILIELAGARTRGMTVVDWGGRHKNEAPRVWCIVQEMSATMIAAILIDSVVT